MMGEKSIQSTEIENFEDFFFSIYLPKHENRFHQQYNLLYTKYHQVQYTNKSLEQPVIMN